VQNTAPELVLGRRDSAMLIPDRYFQQPKSEDEHPKLRFWKGLTDSPQVQKVRFELRRERNGLTFRPAKMLIHFLGGDGSEVRCDIEDWDGELNRSLIEMGIPAISVDNEKERFGLMLRNLLEKPEIRAGASLFNFLFTDTLRDSGFLTKKEVEEKFDKTYLSRDYDPVAKRDNLEHLLTICAYDQEDTRALSEDFFNNRRAFFSETKKMIDWRLQRCGFDLTEKLGYNREDAENILASAVAYYLDERFSITNRELLGFR